jgi:phosphopantetheinyl transferase (holo-ACP synthase)
VGDDVVDLAAQCLPSARFVGRVFTPFERRLLNHSHDPGRTCWMLWAAKEAAFKVAQKLDPDVVFAHVLFEVVPERHAAAAPERALLRGRVVHPDFEVSVGWTETDGFVHCVARFGDARVAYAVKDRRLWTPRRSLTAAEIRSSRGTAESVLARCLAHELLDQLQAPRAVQLLRPGHVGGPPRVSPCEGAWDISLSHDGRYVSAAVASLEAQP